MWKGRDIPKFQMLSDITIFLAHSGHLVWPSSHSARQLFVTSKKAAKAFDFCYRVVEIASWSTNAVWIQLRPCLKPPCSGCSMNSLLDGSVVSFAEG